MWISRRPSFERTASWRRRVLEAVVLAALFGIVPDLLWARPNVSMEPHPGWLAVMLLASRHGTGGFFLGLLAVAVTTGASTVLSGHGLGATWRALDPGTDGAALGAALMVSWVGSWHLVRQDLLRQRLHVASERRGQAERTVEALCATTMRLRARVDRASTSLTFLRDVATRMQGADPVVVAEGAADLALARTGAHGVAVRVGSRGFQRQLAIRDLRGPHPDEPLGSHVPDMVVPIRSGGQLIGHLACWGLSASGMDDATRSDLDVIASWCARSLSNGVRVSPEVRTRSARLA